MAKQIIHSLSDLGSVFNIAAKETPARPERKCSVCGGKFITIPGTNVSCCKPCVARSISPVSVPETGLVR